MGVCVCVRVGGREDCTSVDLMAWANVLIFGFKCLDLKKDTAKVLIKQTFMLLSLILPHFITPPPPTHIKGGKSQDYESHGPDSQHCHGTKLLWYECTYY